MVGEETAQRDTHADSGQEALAQSAQQGRGDATPESGSRRRPGPVGFRALLAGFLPLLITISVAVLARALSVPPPKAGARIGPWSYFVNLTELGAAKELWRLHKTDSGDAVLEAADQLAASFVLSAQDEVLTRFLNESAEETLTGAGRVLAHIKHYSYWSLQRYLGWSRTDASALIRKHLFVASERQIRALVTEHQGYGGAGLLDIGSGLGTETEKTAAALGIDRQHVTCLEVSSSARTALVGRGFRVATSLDEVKGQLFAAVALLNVLDRCDEPLSLLDAAIELLQPSGLLLVGITLPFASVVYEGRVGTEWGKASHRSPRSPLHLHVAARKQRRASPSFELSAAAFIAALLPRDSGIKIEAWTRLPYVSSGDTKRTHYVKDMALFALSLPADVRLPSRSEEPEDSASESVSAPEQPAACSGKNPDAVYSWLSDTVASEDVQTWGEVLDAGAGFGSMCWLLRQAHRSITGVTASKSGTYGFHKMQSAAASSDARVEVVLGNWRDEQFLKERQFDVVVADYLLGAVEYHWPHGADQMMDRLLDAVRPGGYLLIVGMEPYEEVLDAGSSWQDRVVLDVEALGDAAAALAGSATYRELPERWVQHQIHRRAEFKLLASKQFPMTLSAKSLRKQLEFAREKASGIANAGLQKTFRKRADQLEQEVAKFGTHRSARNYAMVVQRQGG